MVDQTYRDLKLLGSHAPLPASPAEAVLERVPNPHPGDLYLVRFTAPEFTTLCPVTGQPDFAHLVIDYAPRAKLIESKSLKLYLGSFRNHADFHEACTLAIGQRLAKLLAPRWLRIGGYWYPRGGMPIDVFWQTGQPPKGLWLPDPGVAPYRGRGSPRAMSPRPPIPKRPPRPATPGELRAPIPEEARRLGFGPVAFAAAR